MRNHNQLKVQSDLDVRDDEISLWDLLGFLQDGRHWFASGALVGLVGAATFLLASSVQYEATAVIQPATVGLPTITGTIKGVEVEPVTQTLERLKIATFYTPEIVQVCQAPLAQVVASEVKSNLVKGNSLIQLSYRAASKAEAEACVSSVVAQLIKSQTIISAPIIKKMEEQLAQSRLRLDEAKEFQAQLEKRAASAGMSSLLMLNALAKREEIARLQKQVLEQSIQLSAPLTQSMQLLEPIYAPESAVSPKKLPLLSGGFFGGLVLGGLAFFARRSWQGHQA